MKQRRRENCGNNDENDDADVDGENINNNNKKKMKRETKRGDDDDADLLMPFHKHNLKSQLNDCLKCLSASCDDLFELTLLVPTAPWTPLKKCPVEQLTQDALLNKLKAFNLPKPKYQQVEMLLKSLLVATNYHSHMSALQTSALNDELKFYRSSYGMQKSYIETVMNLFRLKYEQFLSELKLNLTEPLTSIVNNYWRMKEESSEETLKAFLNSFNDNASKFRDILNRITHQHQHQQQQQSTTKKRRNGSTNVMMAIVADDDEKGGDDEDQEDQEDQLTMTFNKLMNELESEIKQLNENCLSNLEKMSISSIDLKDLSTQSDQLLLDIVNKLDSTTTTTASAASIATTTAQSISLSDISKI